MAKARPSLDVTARPVSTFVAPNQNAVAAELYDQQAVQNALQFADAFSNLSVSAAKLAGALKQQSNEEEILKGQDLVNQSRRSYQQLVSEGQIKPTENPWFAIGAQKASGAMEGMKARAHFETLLEQKIQEDPNFLDDPRGFDAFAYQYTQNVNQFIGDASYMSRSFYESFNPFVASMQVKHEERVIEHNTQKILTSVAPVIDQGLADFSSPNETIRKAALGQLQTRLDEMSKSGVSAQRVNNTVAAYLVEQMKTGDNPEKAKQVFEALKSGTGRVAETQFAKNLVLENQGTITANLSRTSMEETKAIRRVIEGDLAPKVLSGQMTEAEAEARLDAYLTGPSRGVQVGPGEYDQSMNQLRGRIAFLQHKQEQTISEQATEARKQLDQAAANAVGEIEIGIQDAGDAGVDTLDPGYQEKQITRLQEVFKRYDVPVAKQADYLKSIRASFTAEVSRQAQATNARMSRILDQVYNDVAATATSGTLYDASGLEQLQKETDERLAAFGFSPADRAAAQVAVTNQWKAGAAARAEALEQRQAAMASERLANVEAQTQQALLEQISAGGTPDWSAQKAVVEGAARGVGLVDGTEQWNSYTKKRYAASRQLIDGIVEAQAAELGGLAPVIAKPGDNIRVIAEQNAKREATRTRELVMRLDLATAYGQKDAMDFVVSRIMQTPTSALESDQESYEFADVVRATRALVENGREITAIFPGDSDNHKVLHDMLQYAARRSGDNLNEVAKDAYMIRTYATQMTRPTTAQELFANPFGWMTKSEFEQVGPNIQGALVNAGVSNPDATIYGSLEFARLFDAALKNNPANPTNAASVAQREVLKQNVVLNGSLLPKLEKKQGFPRRAGSSEAVYLGALAQEYDNPESVTFVVLRPGPDPIFAVRDAEGNSVARKNGQAPRTYTTQDLGRLWSEQPNMGIRQERPKPGQMPDKQRPDGSMKGSGWLGVHKTPSGRDVTEYSVGIEIDGKQMDIPTMVPGLTKAEVEQVITAAEYGEFPNRAVMDKAVSHARKMLAEGKSVYAPQNASQSPVGPPTMGIRQEYPQPGQMPDLTRDRYPYPPAPPEPPIRPSRQERPMPGQMPDLTRDRYPY